MAATIEPLTATPSAAETNELAALLRDAVEGGASVGFMLPLPETEVAAFWLDVLAGVGVALVALVLVHRRWLAQTLLAD